MELQESKEIVDNYKWTINTDNNKINEKRSTYLAIL